MARLYKPWWTRLSRTTTASHSRASQRLSFRPALEFIEGRLTPAVTSTTPLPISVIENNPFSGAVMDFTANDAGPFTATINWGDGTPPTAGTVTAVAGGFEVSAGGTPHSFADDGSYSVSVQITDTADATSASNTTTAKVLESVLSASGANLNAQEGSPISFFTGTFTDPGSTNPPTDYTASIDWGDGTTTPGVVEAGAGAGMYLVSGTHTYADEGSYTVTTTFFDNDDPGFTISIGSPTTVTEADVFANGVVTLPAGVVEGQVLTGVQVATFSDTGYPTNVASDFTATIDWGDGVSTTGTLVGLGSGNFGVLGSHQYKEEGVYPLSVVVADDPPGTATVTIGGNVTIADAPLSAVAVPIRGTLGTPLTSIDVATFTDADPSGTATDFIASIDWGDGTVTAGQILQDAAGTFHVQGTHTYTQRNAAPVVTVSVTDHGDGRVPGDPTNSKSSTTTTATIDIGVSGRLIISGQTDGSARGFVPGANGQFGPSTSALLPFGGIAASVRIAQGDVDGDGTPDAIAVTGPGVPVQVTVISGRDGSTLVAPFDPFGGGFTGGGFVTAADFDKDGRSEFVVTPDLGGGPRVVVYSLLPAGGGLTPRANFFGIADPGFRGGVRAAAGNVNADTVPDLVVAAGNGGGPRVAVFDGSSLFGTPVRLAPDFFVFEQALRNGVYVAIGDVNGDGLGDLVFGAGPGGGRRVLTLSGQTLIGSGADVAIAAPLNNFLATGSSSTRDGVRVAAVDADGDTLADIVAGSGEGQPSEARVFLGRNLAGGAPTFFQDLDPFDGAVLSDGVFIG